MTGATAITLTQPWAQLVVDGLKHVETRSWSTGYRGRILIHAAKGMPGWAHDEARLFGYRPAELARGAIIGEARLVDVQRTEDLRARLAETELRMGDYGPDRYGWLLEELIRYATPIPAVGRLGLWRATGAWLERDPMTL